jgi:aspartate racemase
MHHSLQSWDSGDLKTLRRTFSDDVDRLAAAGADFFILPDNTAHMALESEGDPFALPCLHIAEVVADQARNDGRGKVGILGTNWTMTGPVYPGALGRRGIDWAVPDEADRQLVHDVIMGELCLGIFTEASRQAYLKIIDKLALAGCDCVALVCTEIPLLVTADVSPLPILDSTRLLARAAVGAALGQSPAPQWRGGPLPAS